MTKSFLEQFPEMECFRNIVVHWQRISRNDIADRIYDAVLEEFEKYVNAINSRQQIEVSKAVAEEDRTALAMLAKGALPKIMIRPDDKEEFVLDEKLQKYTNKVSIERFPNNLHHYYTFDVLRNHGFYAKSSQ